MGRESGHAAVELALAVGLLLVPSAIVVLGFGPWSERAVLAEAAAAEGSRAAVLALDVLAGTEVVFEMADNYDLGGEEIRIGWCGSAAVTGGSGDCTFARGETVTAEVQVWVPLVPTPWGPIGGTWVSRTHSELVDLYRSLG